MSERERPTRTIIVGLFLLIGSLIFIATGLTYLESPDVSDIIATMDVIAGIMMLAGCVCCFLGKGWKVCFASFVVLIVAGVFMMGVTILGGIIIALIGAFLVYWLHTTVVRTWFRV